MDSSMATGSTIAPEASSLPRGPYPRPVHSMTGAYGVGGWVILLIPRRMVVPSGSMMEWTAFPPDGCNMASGNGAKGNVISFGLPGINTAQGKNDKMAANSVASGNGAMKINTGGPMTGATPFGDRCLNDEDWCCGDRDR